MRKQILLSLFLGSLYAINAIADDEAALNSDASDEFQVITVTGYTQDTKNAPASISVVPSEDIVNRPIRDLGDIVQEVPGVTTEVSKTGQQQISMRGMGPAYTLVMIDGKRSNMDPGFDNVGFGPETLTTGFIPPVSMIERVEVVRGPASTRWGSDAMGGTINVITKKFPDKTSASIMLETRLQEHHDIWGNMYGANAFVSHPFSDSVAFNLRAKYNYGEANKFLISDLVPGNYRSNNDYNPYTSHSPTGYINWGVGGRLTFKANDENTFYIDQDYGYQRIGSLNTSGSSYTAVREYRRSNTVLNHDGEYSWGNLNNYIQYMITDRYQHDTNSGEIDPNGLPHYRNAIGSNKGKVMHSTLIEDQQLVLSSSWTKDFDINKKQSLILNFGPYYSWESLYKRGNDFHKDHYQFALFGEGEYFWNDYVSTTAGLRVNFVETYGTFYNPRAYVNVFPTDWLTLKAGIASGMKVPQLGYRIDGYYDSTTSNGITTDSYGNNDLEPEKSWNYEASAIVDIDQAYLTLTGYYTDFKDKINTETYYLGESLPGGNGVCGAMGGTECKIYNNVDKAEIKGFEASLTIKPFEVFSIPGNFKIDLNYGYTKSEQKSGPSKGLPINDIPQQKFSAKLTHKYGNYSSFLRYVGQYRITNYSAHQANAGIGEYYKDLNLVDLGIDYRFRSGFSVGAVINNLFDEDTLDYATYTSTSRGRTSTSYTNQYQRMVPGRNLWLNVKYEF